MPYKAEHVSCAVILSVLSPHGLHRLLEMFRNPLKKNKNKRKSESKKKTTSITSEPRQFFGLPVLPGWCHGWCSAERADRPSQLLHSTRRAARVAGAVPGCARTRAARPRASCARSRKASTLAEDGAAAQGRRHRHRELRYPKKIRAVPRAYIYTTRVAWQITSLRAPASTGAVLPGALLR